MRIYFCSDVHASRKCWKKFLAAPKFYDADIIVMGGDVTGKFIVPIVQQPRGYHTAKFLGVDRRIETAEEMERIKIRIADTGQYSLEMTPDEQAWYAEDQKRVDELFRRLVLERIEEWLAEADAKLKGTGVRCFVSGANDDFLEVDDALRKSEVIEDPNGRVIELGDGYEILGMGYGNPTPWPAHGTFRRTSSRAGSTRPWPRSRTPTRPSSACTCRRSAPGSTWRRGWTRTCRW